VIQKVGLWRMSASGTALQLLAALAKDDARHDFAQCTHRKQKD
jgi:hypothetical protein